MRSFVAPASALVLLAFLVLGSSAAVAEGCKREPAAAWPVRLEHDRPFVDATVNGSKVNVQVDTAAYASVINSATAQRLKLRVDYRTTENLRDGTQVGVATLDELRIGDKVTKGMSVRVVGDLGRDVDFLLGVDFASSYDLELDLPGRHVRAFYPAPCPGESLAYWDPKASEVELQKARATLLPVTLNGKRGVAMLHSALTASRVSTEFAEELGVKPGSAGVVPAGCNAGKPMWMSKFDVSIGNRDFKESRLYVGATQAGVDMYLGADFLRTHRALVSHGRGTMYFTDMGGVPFNARRWLPCDEKLAGKSRKDALEYLDEALTRNARDVDALLRRGSMQRTEKPKEAVADLDAAVALDPSNAQAFSLRAEAHQNLKDYPAAIADLGAAISRGMVTSEIYTVRGDLHRKLAHHAPAIDDRVAAHRPPLPRAAADPRPVALSRGPLRRGGPRLRRAGGGEPAVGQPGLALDGPRAPRARRPRTPGSGARAPEGRRVAGTAAGPPARTPRARAAHGQGGGG